MVNGEKRLKVKKWLRPKAHSPKISNKNVIAEHKGPYFEKSLQKTTKTRNKSFLKEVKEKDNKLAESQCVGSKGKKNITISKLHTEEHGKPQKSNNRNISPEQIFFKNNNEYCVNSLATFPNEKMKLSNNNNNKMGNTSKYVISKQLQEGTKRTIYSSERLLNKSQNIKDNQIFNDFILVLKENQKFLNEERHDTKERFLAIMRNHIDTQKEISSLKTCHQTKKNKNIKECKKLVDFNSNIDIREFRGSSPVVHTKLKEPHKNSNSEDTEKKD